MKKVRTFDEFLNEARQPDELFDKPEQYSMSKAATVAYEALEKCVENVWGKDNHLTVTDVHKWKGGITYTLQKQGKYSGTANWMRISDKGEVVTWPIMRAGVLQNADNTERPFTEKDVSWYTYVLKRDIDWTYDEDVLGKDFRNFNNDEWAKAIKKYKLK